jgi:hypothetical protein
MRLLREEVYANAQSVVATLGGGAHGHLGMVMPEEDYIKIARGGQRYIEPAPPVIPKYSNKSEERSRQRDEYEVSRKNYEEATALHNQLKAQLLQAIPTCYRAALSKRTIGYANVTPKELLSHMLKRYGKITPLALRENLKALEAPWDPDTTIDMCPMLQL